MDANDQLLELLRPFARMVAEEIVLLREEIGKGFSEPRKEIANERTRVLRGLGGIMEIFQCSKSHAMKIKGSGAIDSAITRISPRVFLVDEGKALAAMENRKKGGRRY